MSPQVEATIQTQFESADQQREADQLGMWLFLATEALLFGGLFAGYLTYRILHPDAFAAAAQHMKVGLGTLNTGILLTSSLTVALAHHLVQQGRRRATLIQLGATIVLGCAFLAIKALEYTLEFREGLMPLPGLEFRYDGPPPGQMFFNLYYVMTGLHALHLTVAVVMMGVIFALVWRWRTPDQQARQVEMAGLYWHFVDIVWLFVYPALYLI